MTAVRDEATGVRSIDLADPRSGTLPRWTPGAHVDLVLGEFDRSYSLCGAPGAVTYTVSILREDDGRGGSVHFHEALQPGMRLRLRGPRNHFPLDEDADAHLLIAGGIGITPILPKADRLRFLGADYHLHYLGHSESCMAHLERVRRDHGDRLTIHDADQGNRADLRAIVAAIAPGTIVTACGPDRMLSSLAELTADLPEGTLQVEHFTAEADDPDNNRPFDVDLADSGFALHVPAGKSLLSVLRAAGIDVASDCEEGLCGSCEVRVLEGKIDHRDKVLSRAERSSGDRMMCCRSRADGSRLKLAL